MARRSAFVAEVAATIQARHGQDAESFVLGLSGRWGEGKTHFLGQLHEELEDLGFEVIDLNPWKYAADRVAFLRAFLVQLLETQSWWSRICAAGRLVRGRRWHDAWSMIRPRRSNVARLKTDVTRQRISISRLALLLIPVLAVYWLYTNNFAPQLVPVIAQLKLPITLFLVPVSIWLIQGMVNSQTSSKAVTAVDEFDSMVTLALGAPREQDGRVISGPGVRDIVVFVDDLDRVTASVARGVLDNLRTFFDKPSLSFVVTGDHSVLEDSLGRELAPERKGDQHEEGRRFMKKVFNLYWRLPMPVRSDFESFVDQQLALKRLDVERNIPREEDRIILRQWLLDFCDMNLRLVIRTLDMLLFSLRLVRAQVDVAPEDEKPGLQEVLDKPLLLGRVLLIQDRCAPLFDMMVQSPSLLIDLDKDVAHAKAAAGRGEGPDPVGAFLKELAPRLGDRALNADQLSFLQRFAYQPPLFYELDGLGQVVSHPGPWLHLAGDLSFSDASGPTPEDFVRDAANLNTESLSTAIARCSEAKATPAASAVIKALTDSSITVMEDRVQQVLLLLQLSAEQQPLTPLTGEITGAAMDSLEALLVDVPEEQRVDILFLLLRCVDAHGRRVPSESAGLFKYENAQDVIRVPRRRHGRAASLVVIDWLIQYYAQNEDDCLPHMNELLPLIVGEESKARLSEMREGLVDDLLAEEDDDARELRYTILTRDVPAGEVLLKEKVLDSLGVETTWQWAAGKALQGGSWTFAELTSSLKAWVVSTPEAPVLLDRLSYATDKLDAVSDGLWRELYETRDGDLQGLLDALVGDEGFSALPVPTDVSTSIYRDRVGIVIGTDDEQQAIGLASPLDPDSWFWRSIDKRAARSVLTPIARIGARRHQLQATVRPFWQVWGHDNDLDESVQQVG